MDGRLDVLTAGRRVEEQPGGFGSQRWVGGQALGGPRRPLTAIRAQVWLLPGRQQRWNSPSSRVRACSRLWTGLVAGRLRGTERKRLRWQMFLMLSSVGSPGGKGSSGPEESTGGGPEQAGGL